MKNYYQIFELPPDCTQEDIKSAYRNCAKHYHPDKHDNNEFFNQKFLEIKEAYDVLSNDDLRYSHDIHHGFLNDKKNSFDGVGESAESEYKSKIKVDDYVDWINQWGENGSLDKALQEAEDGIKKFPDSGKLYTFRGHVNRQLGFPIAALKDYKTGFEKKFSEANKYIIDLELIRDNVLDRMNDTLSESMMMHLLSPILYFLLSALSIDKEWVFILPFFVSMTFQIGYINIKSKCSYEEKMFLRKDYRYQLNVMVAIFGGISISGIILYSMYK